MAFKHSFVLCAMMAVSFAAPAIVPVAPAAPVLAKLEDFDAAPQYSFAYDVQDALTGDSKAQYESRNGDVVQGSYSLIEADGTRRIVDYTADPVNGFNAVVSREPAIAVAPLVGKAAVAAPIVAKSVVSPAIPAAPIVAPAAAIAPSPILGKSVVAAAPIVARNFVAPAAAYAAPPVLAGTVVPSGPFAYTLPRAVASRLAPPAIYASPYAAYSVAPNFL